MGIKTTCNPDPSEWHDFFAWRPIHLGTWAHDGRICTKSAWWVTIQRRRKWSGIWDEYVWEYREKPSY